MSKANDARKDAKRDAVVARLKEVEGSRLELLADMWDEKTLDALILAFGLGQVELSQ